MPKFLDVHSGHVGLTDLELAAVHDTNLALEAEEGVRFERAWSDPRAGKVFCLSTGPDREAVIRVHQRAGFPPSEVYELPHEV